MRFQISALTCNVADVGLAEATSQAARCLHVVVESAVVAIVCKVRASRLWTVLEPHTRHLGVVTRWSIVRFLCVRVADEASNRAGVLHPRGVDPVVALALQVLAACETKKPLVRVNLEARSLWGLVLAAKPAVWFPSRTGSIRNGVGMWR